MFPDVKMMGSTAGKRSKNRPDPASAYPDAVRHHDIPMKQFMGISPEGPGPRRGIWAQRHAGARGCPFFSQPPSISRYLGCLKDCIFVFLIS